ncbi:hypothetical protein [Streptomyces poonensis]|uniref:hypothetical protein n=1 Tax=Streptomyces poonensis TaxID=68255 RepID=UPI0022F31E55|nr:hypothetical protein [Streptomyces poonensis]
MQQTTHEENVAEPTTPSDSGIDVTFVPGRYAQALAAQGLLEPIHHDPGACDGLGIEADLIEQNGRDPYA